MARLRRQRRQRTLIHLFVLALAGFAALVVVPLRGAAHLGTPHYAAAYVSPPDTEAIRTATVATDTTAQAASGDAQYIRAPLALDGASQAARAAAVPIAARDPNAAQRPTRSSDVPAAAATPAAGASPAPGAMPGPAGTPSDVTAPDAAPTAAPDAATPSATPPVDTPVNPNDLVTATPTPTPDRHDPVSRDAQYAGAADLSRPLYYDHVVQRGDTVSTIAARYNISSSTVLANNPLIEDRNALFIGQTLRVPATDGVLYHVHLGDTVDDIADTYGVDRTAIVSLAQNGVPDVDSIREGQTILVVGGKPPAPPPPAVVATPSPTPTPAPTEAPTQAPAPPPSSSAPRQAAPAPPPPPPPPTKPPAATTWIWPASGQITSYFGPAHPLGIDIGQSFGQPIIAARAGTVTFAGGDPCCSYGYYVDLDHGSGFSSRYGHFRSWPIVSVGQKVSQGQVLGYAGSTGYSTGPHLHFEIHMNGVVVNPLSYLP